MIAFFRLIRVANLLIIAASLSFFYYFILVPTHKFKLFTTLTPFTNFEFVVFLLSVVFVAAAGNIINDYFDFELDRNYKPERPLAQLKFSLDTAIYLHAAFAIGGVLLGFYLGWRNNNIKIGYIYVVCVLLLYLYSSYIKKIPLAGNVVVSALTGFVFLLIMVFEANFLNTIHFENSFYVMNVLLWKAFIYGGFAFLSNLMREIVKDLEDAEGDAAFNINTIAVAFGNNTAKIAGGVVGLLLLAGVGYYMLQLYSIKGYKELAYLGIVVCVPILYSIALLAKSNTQQEFAKVSLLIKISMITGIGSIPFFYLMSM